MTRSAVTAKPPMRADARRNYEKLLATATAAFEEHGTDASLDDIARRAGVGPGTLYRHFPNREALLEAVMHDAVLALCTRGEELLSVDPADEALITWLWAVGEHSRSYRGLGATMIASFHDPTTALHAASMAKLRVGGALLARARETGRIRTDTEIDDILRLICAVNTATEGDPERATHLLGVMIDGLKTFGCTPPPRTP